ncbi:MAG: prepilin-type N-terminal cleavage/methylation domain-containing protein [Desulfobacula sp.]|nr:prepilin-type N-terminal cleavage/methylation domain-containing protein [Desulfobacula sp.]
MKNKKRSIKNRKEKIPGNHFSIQGFTLIEVMVAISFISIVMVSVFTLQSQTVLMTTETQFQATAPLLAQRRMSEIETAYSDNHEENTGSFGEEFEGYTWHSIVEEVESETLEGVADDLKKISVTVYLGSEEYEYHLTTYRLVYEQGT